MQSTDLTLSNQSDSDHEPIPVVDLIEGELFYLISGEFLGETFEYNTLNEIEAKINSLKDATKDRQAEADYIEAGLKAAKKSVADDCEDAGLLPFSQSLKQNLSIDEEHLALLKVELKPYHLFIKALQKKRNDLLDKNEDGVIVYLPGHNEDENHAEKLQDEMHRTSAPNFSSRVDQGGEPCLRFAKSAPNFFTGFVQGVATVTTPLLQQAAEASESILKSASSSASDLNESASSFLKIMFK